MPAAHRGPVQWRRLQGRADSRQRCSTCSPRGMTAGPCANSPASSPTSPWRQGAAIYGRNRATGKGIRIKAGTARSYYIGLESSMPAIPGFKPPIKALCVVPQGMEEGSELLIDGQEFGLLTGQPADFRFFASDGAQRRHARPDHPRCRTRPGGNQPARTHAARHRGFPEGRPCRCISTRSSPNSAPRTLDETHRLRPPMEG